MVTEFTEPGQKRHGAREDLEQGNGAQGPLPPSEFQRISGPSCGFTLIELLVVISVIVLLMALLLPALSRARKQARGVICRAHLRQWGTVLNLYLQENDGRFLSDTDFLSGIPLLRGMLIEAQTDPNEYGQTHGVQTKGIACCPMATRTVHKTFGTFRFRGETYMKVFNGGTFAAWEIVLPAPSFKGSYGLNGDLLSHWFDGTVTGGEMGRNYVDVTSIRNRGRVPLAFDAGTHAYSLWSENVEPPLTEPNAVAGTLCINRHEGSINVLFLDWSIRKAGLKELWTLQWNLNFNTAGPWTKAGGVLPEDWPVWMRQFKDY